MDLGLPRSAAAVAAEGLPGHPPAPIRETRELAKNADVYFDVPEP